MTSPAATAEPKPPRAPHSSIDWAAEPDLEGLRSARALLKTDRARALRAYGLLAERGSLVSMNFVGGCSYAGDTVPKDIAKAEAFFQRASNAGSIEGTYKLGLLYKREGRLAEAVAAFESCARVDYTPGMNKLGRMLLSGEGVPADPERGKALLERASAMGHLWARRQLVSLLMSGRYGLREMPRGFLLLISANIDVIKIADPNRPTDLLR